MTNTAYLALLIVLLSFVVVAASAVLLGLFLALYSLSERTAALLLAVVAGALILV
jgi:hypothetical protein